MTTVGFEPTNSAGQRPQTHGQRSCSKNKRTQRDVYFQSFHRFDTQYCAVGTLNISRSTNFQNWLKHFEVPIHFKRVDTIFPPSLKVLAVAKENKLLINNETYQVSCWWAIRKIVLRSVITFICQRILTADTSDDQWQLDTFSWNSQGV